MSSPKSRDTIWSECRELVNMAPKSLECWLETEESQSFGVTWDSDSTGHKSGRRIVEIRRTNKDDLADDQWDHMALLAHELGARSARRRRLQGLIEALDWQNHTTCTVGSF